MRLVTFSKPDGSTSYGFAVADGVIEVSTQTRRRYPDLKSALPSIAEIHAASVGGPVLPFAEVHLMRPIPAPDKIICIGLNYATHIAETGRESPKHPPIFTRYPASLVDPGEPLLRPRVSDAFDYEGELAVVIGRPARHVTRDEALAHVAGYTAFQDGSVRDWQRHTSQFWPGKSFQDSGSFGPWIVGTDEIPDPSRLTLLTRVDGEVVQSARLDDLVFDVPALVSYLSTVIELLPGDVIATGTPGGVGLFRDPPRFLEPGQVVEVEISGIGVLSNPIADEPGRG